MLVLCACVCYAARELTCIYERPCAWSQLLFSGAPSALNRPFRKWCEDDNTTVRLVLIQRVPGRSASQKCLCILRKLAGSACNVFLRPLLCPRQCACREHLPCKGRREAMQFMEAVDNGGASSKNVICPNSSGLFHLLMLHPTCSGSS